MALVAMCLGVIVIANDFTALNVALPAIEEDFDVDVDTVQWAINAYDLPLEVVQGVLAGTESGGAVLADYSPSTAERLLDIVRESSPALPPASRSSRESPWRDRAVIRRRPATAAGVRGSAWRLRPQDVVGDNPRDGGLARIDAALMHAALVAARLLLAGVFAVAGSAKLADLDGSRAAVAGFGVPERLARPLGTLLPFAELGIAVALLFAATARGGAIAALALLALFCTGITVSIARGEAPDCHCFGQLHSEPAGPLTLARNAALAGVAAFAAFAELNDGVGVEDIGSLGDAAIGAIAAGLVLAVVIGLGATAALALLRQHGRLLLRVEALEAALRSRGIRIPDAVAPASTPGLPVGGTAPEFDLPDLDGAPVALAALQARGQPLLLLFTDPGCGPCNELLPQVGAWQRELSDRLTIAVLSRGGADANRSKVSEHEIADVLLQEDREVAERYRAPATPSAVLVDASGRIASGVASGQAAIATLVERADAPVLEPVKVRPPATPGDAVAEPEEGLRDLEGEEVRLTEVLGCRPRLVLLWDPGCGFCRRMLPDLLAWEGEAANGSEALLVVSRGDPAENRSQGIAAHVLLDSGFEVGRSLGAQGTPSALLVDGDGRIASEIAVGAEAVLTLARSISE